MFGYIAAFFGYSKVSKEAVFLAMGNQMRWKQELTRGLTQEEKEQAHQGAVALTDYLRSCRRVQASGDNFRKGKGDK